MTNKEFALKDSFFQKCCEAVSLMPTRRQASKFRNKKGKAYDAQFKITREVSSG